MKKGCYLCGNAAEKLTRDHIPPKGFFRPPLPDNLITVSCCKKCNEGFSLDDEAFRAWVATVHNASETGSWILRNKVFNSSFKRSKPLEEYFRKTAAIRILRTSGQHYEVPTITFPIDRANAVLIRITKGLLTHFYPDYDFKNDTFKVFARAPIPEHIKHVHELAQNLKQDSRGEGVFDFCHGIVPGHAGGAWIFVFYSAACFVVLHSASWADKANG